MIILTLGGFLHHSCIWSPRGVCPHPQNDSGCYNISLFSKVLFEDSNVRHMK